MAEPYITIHLEKIEHNARAITTLCAQYGIDVTGVTKVTCGMPQVAKAMLRGGVTTIGESRLENIRRLKANGVHAPFMLLRIPPLSAVETIVTTVDISLNSEISVIEELSNAAWKKGLVHDIILMVDLGDLREGIWPDDLLPLAREVVKLPNIRIVGLGTNLSCYGGVIPTEENMNRLVEYACRIEGACHLKLRYISGGNSSSLNLIASGKMPERVNHLRIGEAILLGRETVHRMAWPDTHQDAFLLHAEVIELKQKPSLPIGETSEDAFGRKPVFEDKGDMLRGILNIGREDMNADGIVPCDARLSILGASSDHLLLDVTAAREDIRLGQELEFTLNYGALLTAMTSAYVEKRPVNEGNITHTHTGVAMLELPASPDTHGLSRAMGVELLAGFDKLGVSAIRHSGNSVWPVLKSKTDNSVPFLERCMHTNRIIEAVGDFVEQTLADETIPLVLSADPLMSLGSYLGLARTLSPFGLIVLSAYGGFRTFTAKAEDRIENSTLAAALGYGDPDLASCGGINPKLEAEKVVLIGVRQVEPEEAQVMRDSRIMVFTMEDIDAFGMQEVCYRALRTAGTGTGGVHVTLDLSVLDPGVAPEALNPVHGGISYRETHLAMELIARSGLLSSLDVVGFSPLSTKGASTAKVAAEFILSLFGKRILG